MDETLKDLAYVLRDESAMETDDDSGANGTRERKSTKTLLVKGEAAHKKLQTFVRTKIDLCVYIVFQMAIDTYTKRQLYRAGDKETDNNVNDLFLNINLGQAHCSYVVVLSIMFFRVQGLMLYQRINPIVYYPT